MGRPRIAHAKHRIIGVRLSEQDTQALDAARGPHSRSAYVRTLVQRALRVASENPRDQEKIVLDSGAEYLTVEMPVEHHWHRYKKAGEPVRYIQGRPVYRQKCIICGDTKVGE